MVKIKRCFWLTVFVVSVWLPQNAVADNPSDILIIVNKGVSENKVDPELIRHLFLKIKTRWKKGTKVVPIHAKDGTQLRKEFLARLLKMTPDVEKAYWRDQKIKVGLSKPPEFGNVQKAVFKLKGAIGYIYRSQYLEGVVKVVLVVPAE